MSALLREWDEDQLACIQLFFTSVNIHAYCREFQQADGLPLLLWVLSSPRSQSAGAGVGDTDRTVILDILHHISQRGRSHKEEISRHGGELAMIRGALAGSQACSDMDSTLWTLCRDALLEQLVGNPNSLEQVHGVILLIMQYPDTNVQIFGAQILRHLITPDSFYVDLKYRNAKAVQLVALAMGILQSSDIHLQHEGLELVHSLLQNEQLQGRICQALVEWIRLFTLDALDLCVEVTQCEVLVPLSFGLLAEHPRSLKWWDNVAVILAALAGLSLFHEDVTLTKCDCDTQAAAAHLARIFALSMKRLLSWRTLQPEHFAAALLESENHQRMLTLQFYQNGWRKPIQLKRDATSASADPIDLELSDIEVDIDAAVRDYVPELQWQPHRDPEYDERELYCDDMDEQCEQQMRVTLNPLLINSFFRHKVLLEIPRELLQLLRHDGHFVAADRKVLLGAVRAAAVRAVVRYEVDVACQLRVDLLDELQELGRRLVERRRRALIRRDPRRHVAHGRRGRAQRSDEFLQPRRERLINTFSTASSDWSTATWRDDAHGSFASEKCTRLSNSPSICRVYWKCATLNIWHHATHQERTTRSAEEMTTLVEIRAENERIKEEIHALVMRNTKLQREILTVTTTRELAAVKGSNKVQKLTDELNALDDELTSVRAQCDAINKANDAHKHVPTDLERLGEEISNESSMSSTRFRRMSSAILGANNPNGPISSHGKPVLPPTRFQEKEKEKERTRGMSVANAIRRGSVMMRFTSTLAKKASSSSNSSSAAVHDNESVDDSDDNRSVNIDEISPLPSPFTPSSSGSSVRSTTSSSSGRSGSGRGGRPPQRPLTQNASANVLMYKSTDEKKSLVDSNPLHLNNFRRRERSSRKLLETENNRGSASTPR
ncbi:40s ribosomal protein s27, partial [Globisporangium splendens]